MAAVGLASLCAVAQPAELRSESPVAACLRHAAAETDLLDFQQRLLCRGAPSPTAPVDCFRIATQELFLTDRQGILLCECTPSLIPVDCFRHLRATTLRTEPEILDVCSPVIVYALRVDCSPPR